MKIGSTFVKPGAMLLTSVDDCGVPHFGSIEEVFVDCTQQVFVGLRLAETVEYLSHFHSWVIRQTDALQLCMLESPTLLWPRQCNGCVCVSLKYALYIP